ncbi:PE family protein [Mycobacterium szulgai]|uniref:PE family protein n=1 Tax=Mycobacterium szulgai TaxID=1787 RepID=A0A1X2EDI7_MYCSZ|nr:PE family protein [Mycobacterium szulgai]MCV7076087.1 PE family protein [Mycobacterium szulgai]ORW98486.1 PE family protein [Mycobacterium szulgai]
MSYVITDPEALTAAADSLAGICAALDAQNAATAGPTTSLVPAANDEISALTAAIFSAHGQLYQQVSSQAVAIFGSCVHDLSTGARSYASTEGANAMAMS